MLLSGLGTVISTFRYLFMSNLLIWVNSMVCFLDSNYVCFNGVCVACALLIVMVFMPAFCLWQMFVLIYPWMVLGIDWLVLGSDEVYELYYIFNCYSESR